MKTSQAKKITAFKELFKIAQEGEFDHYCPGAGAHCLDPIRFSKPERQRALNETLYNLANRKIINTVFRPYNVASVEEERRVIQLTLAAGADPNYAHYYSFYYDPEPVFDAFIRNRKYHGALEVAKTEGFCGPASQGTFEILRDWLIFPESRDWPDPCDPAIISAVHTQEYTDKRELVYTLFSKGIYPYNPKIRQALQPVFEQEQKLKSTEKPREIRNTPRGGRS